MKSHRIICIVILIALLFCGIQVVAGVGTIDLKEGITESSKTRVELTSGTGSVAFLDKTTGLSLSTSTMIDGKDFIPSKTTIDKSMIWDSGEAVPKVSIKYDYSEKQLKETIILTEETDLRFPLKSGSTSRIIRYQNGFRIIPTRPLSTSWDGGYPAGIVISKPFGTDANGRYIEMEYEFDGEILLLKYDRFVKVLNLTLTEKLNEKGINPITKQEVVVLKYDIVPIAYPLTIDPSYYLSAYTGYLQLLLHNNQTFTVPESWFNDSHAPQHYLKTYGNTVVSNTTKKLGNASAYFDGVDDYLTVPVPTGFATGANDDFTVSLWVNVVAFPAVDTYLFSGSTQAGCMALRLMPNQKLYFDSYAVSTQIASDTTINSGAWYHLAVIRSGGTSTLYINGVAHGSGADVVAYGSAINAEIGTNIAANYYNGFIDEFAFWNGVAIPIGSLYPQNYEIGELLPQNYYNPMGYILADGANNKINFYDFQHVNDGEKIVIIVSGEYEVA